MYDLVVSFLGEPHYSEIAYEDDRRFHWYWIPMARVLELKQLLQSDFPPMESNHPDTLGFDFYGAACYFIPNRNDPNLCMVAYAE